MVMEGQGGCGQSARFSNLRSSAIQMGLQLSQGFFNVDEGDRGDSWIDGSVRRLWLLLLALELEALGQAM